MAKEFKQTISLPDTFMHEGKVMDAGEHVITDEKVFNDLSEAVHRYNERKAKELEEETLRMQSLNVSSAVPTLEGGVDMATIQALIEQSVEAKTAELRLANDELQQKLDKVESDLADALAPDDTTTAAGTAGAPTP